MPKVHPVLNQLKVHPVLNQLKAHAAGRSPAHQAARGAPVINHQGVVITQHTLDVLHELALAAGVSYVRVTSAFRSPGAQAAAWFSRHVSGHYQENDKNPEARRLIGQARQDFRAGRVSKPGAIGGMEDGIEHAHGGPGSISHHLETLPWREVVDVAKFAVEARTIAFIQACRAKMPHPVMALGHDQAYGMPGKAKLLNEFKDSGVVHIEIAQLWDRVDPRMVGTVRMIA